MAGNITSATATIFLSVDSVFPTPQQLQGFSADDAFDVTALNSAEISMGIDGKMSSGFVFATTEWSITLQADSDSNSIFEQWWAQNYTDKTVYLANGIVTIVSLGNKYTMTNGVLSSYPTMSDAKKIMQPRKYGITWEVIQPSLS